MAEVDEYANKKHATSFAEDPRCPDLIARIRTGIRILCQWKEYAVVSQIFFILENQKRKLRGFSFKQWVNELTFLEDDQLSNLVPLVFPVVSSFLSYYKLSPFAIYDMAKVIAHSGNQQIFDSFREIVVACGFDANETVDAVLTERHEWFTDDEEPGTTIERHGLVTITWVVRPHDEYQEEPKEEINIDKVQSKDEVLSLLAEHRMLRQKHLPEKINASKKTACGLYPHEIATLFQCEYWTSLGAINPAAENISICTLGADDLRPWLADLTTRGYLSDSDIRYLLSKHTKSELSDLLMCNGLKVSGKKDELLDRILSNISVECITSKFPEKRYCLTALGQEVLERYPFVSHIITRGARGMAVPLWYGNPADIWTVFETVEHPENLTIEDIAQFFGLEQFVWQPEPIRLGDPTTFAREVPWPGEYTSYYSPEGKLVRVCTNPFWDRDYDPYDDDAICRAMQPGP